MDSLTPSDLFSPSKARQQRARAQDWAHIDSWLSYKYAGRTVPPFERNEETLKVLRELSAANERADEERAIAERVEREALKELDEAAVNDPNDVHILSTIRAHLSPEGSSALTALVSTTIALSTPSPDPHSLAHTLISHTATTHALTNDLAHVRTLQDYLSAQHALLRAQLHDLHTDPAFSAPAALQRQTIDHTRQTKHLRTKLREAESQLSALQASHARAATTTPGSKSITSADAIAAMLEQQQALAALEDSVDALEDEVARFAGLPADLAAARKEVGRLEVRCDEARRTRDELFEGLVG